MENLELRKKIIVQAKLGQHAALYASFDVEAASVYRVIQIANKKPYVCISASRKTNSVEDNREKTKELLSHIKEAGLYAYQLIGGYEEEQPDGRFAHVVESSFFVPFDERSELSDFIHLFKNLMVQYNQDSILLGLPEGFDYKDWKPEKDIEVGGHYLIYRNGTAEKIGTKAIIQNFDKFGSIAIDPNKDRIIEWVIAGVTTPSGASGCFAMNRAGLRWFWDTFPETNPKDYADEQKAVKRALAKVLRQS